MSVLKSTGLEGRPYPHPSGLNTRFVEAGDFSSFSAGRIGRWTSSPPQLGQIPRSLRAQSTQKVHSKEQMRASAESGGRSRSQHSHPGRISSMAPFYSSPRARAITK
jgi:hypothetical protein